MVRFILNVYIFVLVADMILSYLPQYRHQSWARTVRQAADFTCVPVRKILPQDLPLDLSPIVVVIFIKIFMLLW